MRLKTVWLRLLCLLGCLELSSGARRCFLYPVQKGEWSPEFPLNEGGDTGITINNINSMISGVMEVTLDGKCIAKISYGEARTTDGNRCPVFSTVGDYVHLLVQRLEEEEEGVGVRLGGLTTTKTKTTTKEEEEEEVRVPLELKGKAAALRVTSTYYVNVAYDCPLGERLQFEDASIHQSFRSSLQGSLAFGGRVLETAEGIGGKGYIEILGAPTGYRTTNRRVGLQRVTSSDWHDFALFVLFRREHLRSGHYVAFVSVHYNLSSEPIFSEDRMPFASPDLFLRFRTSENMAWSILQTQDPNRDSSRSPHRKPCGSAEAQDSPREERTLVMVFGAICGLLLLIAFLLTAYVFRLRKLRKPRRRPSSGDVDLKQLQVSEGRSRNVSHQDKRKSHESINSIYDWVEKDHTNASK